LGGLLLSAGCGYSLAGRGSFLPEHIKTIGVPTFVNVSTQPGVAEMFTEKVIEEFASRGKYVVQPEAAGADAVLVGTVLSFQVAPETLRGGVNEVTANEATRYSLVVQAKVEFQDLLDGSMIWEDENFRMRESWEIGEESEEFFDQSGMAIERVAEEFAKTLVSRILEAF
jgi:hypothetical protein